MLHVYVVGRSVVDFLYIGDNWTLARTHTAELQSGVFEPPFEGLRGKVGALSIAR